MKYQKITKYIEFTLSNDPFFKELSPCKINNGNCEDFAMLLEDNFPKGRMVWGDEIPEAFTKDYVPDFHSFFEYEEMYFDAECSKGVNSPMELPFFKRQHLLKND